MRRIIVPFLLGCLVSLYFFPICFTFIPPSINSKMMLALLGLLVFAWNGIKGHQLKFHQDVFFAAALAALFSLVCYISIYVNNTDDTSYATYFMSFFTWLGGAYAICAILKAEHGRASLNLISKYLVWVGFGQCVSVLMIDNIPAFSHFVDSFMNIGQQSLRDIDRLYGIGSALDPAGVRFSVILILLAHVLCNDVIAKGNSFLTGFYIFAFLFITVVGNMVSRTATVGSIFGFGYLLVFLFSNDIKAVDTRKLKGLFVFLLVLAIVVPVSIYLYNTDAQMHSDLRFAFEGFFNWAETGKWSTSSTDKLNTMMWIWPKDPQSWFIGTGRFEGWVYSTDIGYCRFILYCGLLGFGVFSLFFIYNAIAFNNKFEGVSLLAFLLFALTFVVWIKVATDIYLIYALFQCADSEEEDDEEEATDENTLLHSGNI